MKEGYIPRDQRKKILMLSDDIRTFSGVGNMAKEIIEKIPTLPPQQLKVNIEVENIEEEKPKNEPYVRMDPKPRYKSPWGQPGGAKNK